MDKQKVFIQTIEVMMIYLFSILISIYIESFISQDLIYGLMGDASGLVGIAAGVLLGLILPGPRYAIYPIALVLMQNGAAIAPIVSLFFAQQMLTFPDGTLLEIKFMGVRFTIWRFLVSLIASGLGGVLVAWMLRF
jgi:uncharacterized membrane protein YraQ (UPF0718 family)